MRYQININSVFCFLFSLLLSLNMLNLTTFKLFASSSEIVLIKRIILIFIIGCFFSYFKKIYCTREHLILILSFFIIIIANKLDLNQIYLMFIMTIFTSILLTNINFKQFCNVMGYTNLVFVVIFVTISLLGFIPNVQADRLGVNRQLLGFVNPNPPSKLLDYAMMSFFIAKNYRMFFITLFVSIIVIMLTNSRSSIYAFLLVASYYMLAKFLKTKLLVYLNLIIFSLALLSTTLIFLLSPYLYRNYYLLDEILSHRLYVYSSIIDSLDFFNLLIGGLDPVNDWMKIGLTSLYSFFNKIPMDSMPSVLICAFGLPFLLYFHYYI